MTSHSRDHICLTHHFIPQHEAQYMFVVLMNENPRMPVTEESFQGPNHFLIVYISLVIVLCGGPGDKSQIPGESKGSRTLTACTDTPPQQHKDNFLKMNLPTSIPPIPTVPDTKECHISNPSIFLFLKNTNTKRDFHIC